LLEGAPYSGALVELVRECVGEVQVQVQVEGVKGRYLPVKINAVETWAPGVGEKEKKGTGDGNLK
jgi:hypothetical protein